VIARVRPTRVVPRHGAAPAPEPAPTPTAAEWRSRRAVLWALWGALWVVHATVAIGLLASFVILPIKEPFWVWLPGQVFLAFFATNETRCPCTTFENLLRARLGLPPINQFVPHYLRVLGRRLRALTRTATPRALT
jgi:hypothetical protein